VHPGRSRHRERSGRLSVYGRRLRKADPIATGHTAEIFAWSRGRVLKLLHAGRPANDAIEETCIIAAVHAVDIAAPKVYEVVRISGRHGFVLERLPGSTLRDRIRAAPRRLAHHAGIFADPHAHLHEKAAGDLPRQRGRLLRRIGSSELPSPVRDRVPMPPVTSSDAPRAGRAFASGCRSSPPPASPSQGSSGSRCLP
jgi:hypothetical protein